MDAKHGPTVVLALGLAFAGTAFATPNLAEVRGEQQHLPRLMGLAPGHDAHVEVVSLEVRTIKAANVERQRPGTFLVDERLADLRQKLQQLPFNSFELLEKHNLTAPVKRRSELQLSRGNRLTVRPLYHDGEKVGMWLKWRDGRGEVVLDTRMHFMSDEAMLAGTEDLASNGGIVLAVRVTP